MTLRRRPSSRRRPRRGLRTSPRSKPRRVSGSKFGWNLGCGVHGVVRKELGLPRRRAITRPASNNADRFRPEQHRRRSSSPESSSRAFRFGRRTRALPSGGNSSIHLQPATRRGRPGPLARAGVLIVRGAASTAYHRMLHRQKVTRGWGLPSRPSTEGRPIFGRRMRTPPRTRRGLLGQQRHSTCRRTRTGAPGMRRCSGPGHPMFGGRFPRRSRAQTRSAEKRGPGSSERELNAGARIPAGPGIDRGAAAPFARHPRVVSNAARARPADGHAHRELSTARDVNRPRCHRHADGVQKRVVEPAAARADVA